MIFLGKKINSLNEALEEYPGMSKDIYDVYYNKKDRMKELMLDFSEKDPYLEEMRKKNILEEEYNPKIAYYVYIPEKKGNIRERSIKVIRPVYNIVDVKDKIYLEDMPQHYLQEYYMYVENGVRELVDTEGYIIYQSLDISKLNF